MTLNIEDGIGLEFLRTIITELQDDLLKVT